MASSAHCPVSVPLVLDAPELKLIAFKVPEVMSTVLPDVADQLPVSVPAVPVAPVVNVNDFNVPSDASI